MNVRKTKINVATRNYCFVDKNGEKCNENEKGSRLLRLKRPKVKYFKNVDRN